MSCFENTLCYTAPSHGDWGIVRIAALVPETHLLFVSPSACGRHGALGALQHGFKDRVSYLAITREDIIAGYDQLVEEAVAELLRRRKPRPKAVMIFVSCLDDLIGTDLSSLCGLLHGAHPEVEFQPAHMNPITLDSKKPPMVTTQAAMYAFLHPAKEHDQGVNLMGNLDALSPDCELFDVLKGWGCAPVRHLSDFETFEDYQSMAKSRASLLLSPIASLAAQQMEARLGIPHLFLPVSYDIEEVDAQYAQLAAFLEKRAPDLSHWREEALSETEKTRRALNGRPVWIRRLGAQALYSRPGAASGRFPCGGGGRADGHRARPRGLPVAVREPSRGARPSAAARERHRFRPSLARGRGHRLRRGVSRGREPGGAHRQRRGDVRLSGHRVADAGAPSGGGASAGSQEAHRRLRGGDLT